MNENFNLSKSCLQIGDKAPLFNANSTIGNIKLSDYAGKWVVFFSHPGDFTPVCTTEFIAFSKLNDEFNKRNCNLLGLSVDSNPSHLAWLNSIYNSTGIKIPFPIISDTSMQIAKMYSMTTNNPNTTSTIRSVYIIDPNQIIRSIFQYPKTTGRNIGEILRTIDALQITDKEDVLTPANWIPGNNTILKSPSTFDEIMNKNNFKYNCIDWYLCFNNSKGDI